MKGREIRERLQGKVDPDVLHTLCALGEEMSHMRQGIIELERHVNQLTTIVTNFVVVAEHMKKTIKVMQGAQDDSSDSH